VRRSGARAETGDGLGFGGVGQTPTCPRFPPRPHSGRTRQTPTCPRSAPWLTALILLLLAATAAYPAPAVYVLPLRADVDSEAGSEWLGYLVSDVANRALGRVARVPALDDAERATRAQRQALGLIDTPNEAALAGAEMACQFVAYGSLRVLGEDAIIDVEVLDVASGMPAVQQSFRGTTSASEDLVARVLERVAVGAGLEPVGLPALRTAMPATESPDAIRQLFAADHLWDRAVGAEAAGLKDLAHESLTECIAALGRAIQADPAFGWPYERLGRATKHVLALDPKNGPAYSNLALVCRHTGDYVGAVAALREAARLVPNDYHLQLSLGNALVDLALSADAASRLAPLGEAQAAFRAALEAAPNDPTCHINLAAALYYLGDLDEAGDEYARAAALDPSNAAAFLGVGLSRARMGRVTEAQAAFRQAMALDPQGPIGRRAQRELGGE